MRRIELSPLLSYLGEASLGPLILSLVTKAVGFAFLAARSRTLFACFGRWGIAPFARAHLIGFGGNILFPLRLGEVLRVGELARGTGVATTSCLGIVVVERGLDLLWLLIFALLLPTLATLDLPLPSTLAASLAAAMLGLATAAWLSSRPDTLGRWVGRVGRAAGPRIGARMEQAAAGFASGLAAIASPLRFLIASLWTLGYWCTGAFGIALWLHAFGLPLPWFAAPTVLVFIAVGVALPAAPGYVGTYHAFAIGGLALFGVETTRAAAVAITGHFLATVPFALLAILLFFDRLHRVAHASTADLLEPFGDTAGPAPCKRSE